MRRRLAGTVRVPLPPDEAFALFTPRGEEDWVDGWHPHFPADPASAEGGDGSEPGTVFVTGHGGEQTIWVVVAREPGKRISYTRTTPTQRAGTVSVEVTQDGRGGSAVRVVYDLTALTDEGAREIEAFADGYAAFLTSWEVAIAAHLRQSTRSTSKSPSA